MSSNANLSVAHKNHGDLRHQHDVVGNEANINLLIKTIADLSRTNKELYRILDNINEVFFKIDLNGEFIDIHTSAFPVVGHNPEDVSNKSIYDFVHPEEAEILKQIILEGFKEKKVVKDVKHRFLHSDGTWHWLNTSGEPVFDDNGNPLYIIGLSYDITDRVNQENQLKENEENYRQLFTLHPLPLIVFEEESLKILEVNTAAIDQYGYSKEEFSALTLHDLRPKDSVDELKKQLQEKSLKNDNSSYKAYWCEQKKNGEKFYIEANYHSIVFHGKRAWLKSVNDITEKKKSEEALRQSELRYRIFIEQSTEATFRYESLKPIPIDLPEEEQLEMMLSYGYLAECNDQVAKQYNFEKAEQVIGLKLSTAISFDNVANRNAMLEFIRSGYRAKEVRTYVTNKSGLTYTLTNNLIGIIENGCLVRVWGIARDITAQLKKEKQINYLAQLVESVSDGIYSCDINLTILSWNKAAEKIYGIKAEDAIGKTLSDFIEPSYQIGSRQAVMEEVLSKGVWKGEVNFFRHQDKKDITLLSSVSLLKDELDHPIAFIITSKDITERKEADKLIAESEKRFKIMADCAPVMIWTTDKDDKTNYYNEGWLHYTGKSLTEELEEKWEDKIHPDDRRRVVEQYNSAAKEKKEFTIEYRLRKHDGSYEWMIDRGSPRLLEDGSFVGYIGVCFNIQDRKKTEEELFISKERYDLINKATNEAIWDADLERNISQWGTGYQRLFGYDPEKIEVNEQFWLSKVHPQDRNRVQEIFLNYDKDPEKNVLEAEYRFLKADGTYALVKDVAFLIRNGEGKPIRIVGSKKDITLQREMESKLMQSEINKQILITQATLAGQEKEREAISKELHDNINQVISSTKLYLEVVRNNPMENIELINRSIENLNMVVQENRKISKSLSPPSLGDVNLEDALEELIADINLTNKVKAQFNYLGSFNDKLITEEMRISIYRILQEQLNNILKHAEATEVNVDLTRQHNRLMLSIADNGKGFDPQQKRKGIGITNIINRTTLLHGSAEIESEPGKGCVLNIIIPL